MIAQLAQTIAQLSRRERVLLGGLVFGAVPLALVFLVALPLVEAREQARAQGAEAKALYQWVEARDAEWDGQQTERPQAAARRGAPVGIAGIEAALAERNMRAHVTRLETRPNGTIRLAMDGARFVDVARFLERAGPDLGYGIASLALTPGGAPGQISVKLDLAP